ncbi:hypothetical protein D3C84_956490 [compost metagenome]
MPLVLGADGLGRVLHHRDAVALTEGQQRFHVTEVAVQVHGNDRLGSRRDGSFDSSRIQAPGVLEDVDEYRRRPQVHDRRD